jgi:hypothetical protein
MNRLLLLAPLLSITSCASGPESGPSLLPRAVEEQTFDEPAAPPAPAAAPDPALDRQIADLVTRRGAASTAFAAADRQVAAALRSGARAPVGSDAWLDAQTALAALDEERATLLAVVTDLEQLAIARAADGKPPYPALDAARIDSEAELDRIAAIVAERKAALPLQ